MSRQSSTPTSQKSVPARPPGTRSRPSPSVGPSFYDDEGPQLPPAERNSDIKITPPNRTTTRTSSAVSTFTKQLSLDPCSVTGADYNITDVAHLLPFASKEDLVRYCYLMLVRAFPNVFS